MNMGVEISVLVPVYNAGKTIKACIWSILNQSYTSYELLLYLDGCTDNSEEIIREFSDPRIQIIVSDTNQGIVHARNALVKKAKGRFIAWLDADDIALPGRLASQYEFMHVHPELKLLGSWVEVRNGKNIKKVKWPVKPEVLDAWMFFRNPFAQSSLMIRNIPEKVVYDPDFEYLEDYWFASDFLGKNCVAIYPEYLCSYLEDDEKNRIEKYLKYDFVGKLEKIMRHNFAVLKLHPGKNDLALIREFLRNSKSLKKAECKRIMHFLLSAKKQNEKLRVFSINAFNGVLCFQLLRLAKTSPSFGVKIMTYLMLRPGMFMGFFQSRVAYIE